MRSANSGTVFSPSIKSFTLIGITPAPLGSLTTSGPFSPTKYFPSFLATPPSWNALIIPFNPPAILVKSLLCSAGFLSAPWEGSILLLPISAILPIKGPFSPKRPESILVRSFIPPESLLDSFASLGLAVEALLEAVAASFSLFTDLSVAETRDSVADVFFLMESARELIFLPRSAI